MDYIAIILMEKMANNHQHSMITKQMALFIHSG